MRTTLDIDEDVLQAVKELARHDRTTAGRVISNLARKGLNGGKSQSRRKFVIKNGIPVRPSRGKVITLELIQQIVDEEGI